MTASNCVVTLVSVPEKKTKQETIYVPSETAAFIQSLADNGIIGTKKGEIYSRLIADGVDKIIREDTVRKTLEARQLLAKK